MRLFRVLRISSAGNTPQCPVPVCPPYGPVPFNDKPDHPATQNGACRYPRVRLRVQLLHNSRTFCPTSAPTYGICMWVDSRGISGLGMRSLPLLHTATTTTTMYYILYRCANYNSKHPHHITRVEPNNTTSATNTNTNKPL